MTERIQRKKALVKGPKFKPPKSSASITMSINEAHFHAEGEQTEVTRKFRDWLDKQIAERTVVKVDGKVLKK